MTEEMGTEATGADLGTGADGQGGGEGEPTGYAGFETPEALAEAYQSTTGQVESLSKQIKDLESIKGRQGNEMFQLKQQLAQMQGRLEGMNQQRQQAPAQRGPTLDDIAKQLESGDISEATAIRLASQITANDVQTRLGRQFQQQMQKEIGGIHQKMEQKEYVRNFLAQNKGYEEAYTQGKLSPWLEKGMSGEEAWDKYQLQAKEAELSELRKQANQAAKKAEESGFDKGIKINQGKLAAGKVLAGKGGKMGQADGGYNLNDPTQRRQAGSELLKRMRGGG